MSRLISFQARWVFLWLAAATANSGWGQTAMPDTARVVLTAPLDDATVVGDIRFQWRRTIHISRLRGFDIHIFAKRNAFLVAKSVVPFDTGRSIGYTWVRFRKDVPKHGRYFWFVDAVDSSGRRYPSEIRSFVVAPLTIQEQTPFTRFAHTVWMGHTYRMKTSEYRTLLEGVDPRAHLMSYGEIAFMFRQNAVRGTRWRLEETVRFFSLTGFGLGAGLQYPLMGNDYISLSPYWDGSLGWAGSGLNSHSSNQTRYSLGCEMLFLPRGYVSIFTEWVPMHRIRYLQSRNGLRTFEGKGWETGLRVVFPRSLLSPVHFLGMEIDWEKIVFEFRFSRVRDRYTGAHMDSRRMGLGFLLP